ncbi:MAG: M23 family metallopeptidase [Cellvibrionales bacterium TMED47]|nr:peptidase [Porticoccaceae bacterium]RPG82637.1 MAG: M23 family metallopeptidase [Cellvibrionales bacterium TMED47]
MLVCKIKFRVLIIFSYLILIANISASDDPKFVGTFQQGGLVLGQLAEGETVSYKGKSLKINNKNQFLLGFGRNEPSEVEITVHDQLGERNISLNIAARDYAIQKIEGVPQKTVNPSKEHLNRIQQDAASVRKARRLISNQDDFTAGFIEPSSGPITGVYGSQRFYNGVPKSPHYGIDYAAPIGTPVIAPAGGIITLVHNDMFYSGGTLILDHGHGLSSTFLHLSQILVTQGQRVTPGMVIAKIGASGRATGPHLDWRMNWLDQRIDPQLVLQTLPVQK